MIRTKKYYPAPNRIGNRYSERDRITLRQAVDLMQDILKIVPSEVQQEVYIVGWDKIAIYADQQLSPADLIEEKTKLLADLELRMQQPDFAQEEITKALQKLQEIR